eukprot:9652956-Alexandrium_andersonii.AAC.1
MQSEDGRGRSADTRASSAPPESRWRGRAASPGSSAGTSTITRTLSPISSLATLATQVSGAGGAAVGGGGIGAGAAVGSG